ncbi:erythromycin esterase-like protein [Stackebrandtia albiflava]|uniref:Erythromycin esterase-like protein n=1 Tax=Stackebrandtia albiflava TaxID=406432 RepID=A0A562V1K6_9ACTN|nr:erythromycin esterase family protein [Stackebrandtia albiflava]TWJ11754.1 erythromycin esterase-like protein [Stackebrandtia albiflava]
MTRRIQEFLAPSCELLAYGEPTHLEPAFGRIRNTLFTQLVALGFRSVAVESDRAAALVVDDFVRRGHGTLDEVMRDGFSHGFGAVQANRDLVVWMRDHNEHLPEAERLAFHGFDASVETMSAPSPRRHLEPARHLLGFDVDFADLLGDDERWSRTEAVMDAAESPGATPEAVRAAVLADDMLTDLYTRAPELIAATSPREWTVARTHLVAAIGLLRYHRRAADPGAPDARWNRMCATRDALMAQNLLDIRRIESPRGGTLVFAHNLHLQRNVSDMDMGPMHMHWNGAGAILSPLLGDAYRFVAGSLGRSDGIGLAEPPGATVEAALQDRVTDWGILPAGTVPDGDVRTDHVPEQGYFPLEAATVHGADLVLHVSGRTGGDTAA